MTTATKKITRATIKSFIRKNREDLLILTKSSFSGMSDMCEETGETEFSPALEADRPNYHNLGIHGAWFVGQSRDWFQPYENGEVKGFQISNCCGRFILAVKI